MTEIEKIEAMREAGWGVFVYCHPTGNDAPVEEKFVGQICGGGKRYEAKGPSFNYVIDQLILAVQVIAKRN